MARTDTRNLIPTFPARLTELRERAGLSKQALAVAAGSSIFSVMKLEKGSRSPSLALAIKIAAALQVDMNTLVAPPGGKISKKK